MMGWLKELNKSKAVANANKKLNATLKKLGIKERKLSVLPILGSLVVVVFCVVLLTGIGLGSLAQSSHHKAVMRDRDAAEYSALSAQAEREAQLNTCMTKINTITLASASYVSGDSSDLNIRGYFTSPDPTISINGKVADIAPGWAARDIGCGNLGIEVYSIEYAIPATCDEKEVAIRSDSQSAHSDISRLDCKTEQAIAQEKAEKAERERLAKEEAERKERERMAEAERREKERVAEEQRQAAEAAAAEAEAQRRKAYNEEIIGYCKDGKPIPRNRYAPSNPGQSNYCYGHGGYAR